MYTAGYTHMHTFTTIIHSSLSIVNAYKHARGHIRIHTYNFMDALLE